MQGPATRLPFLGPRLRALLVLAVATLLAACGGEEATEGAGGGRGGPGGGRGGFPGAGGFGGGAPEGGVPVEVAAAGRRPISVFFETNVTLEAEQAVDLVARAAGPVVTLAAEEGDRVRRGQVLARLDDREIRAQLEVTKVRREEAELAYERAQSLYDRELISLQTLEESRAAFQAAEGDTQRLEVQLTYTVITAPFSGLIVERYVRNAEYVTNATPLFRLVDFDPLLAKIQVPERELPRLSQGQRAELAVEAYPGERFEAEVLRLSPVVDSETGTVRVTLAVTGRDRLRPGMFASVYLELDRRPKALVIPASALALDSLGDAAFVAVEAPAEEGAPAAGGGAVAERRDLELGFKNDTFVEVLSGISQDEPVIVIGQDGLADGTPVDVRGTRSLEGQSLNSGAPAELPAAAERAPGEGRGGGGFRGPGGFGGGGFDPSNLSPEQLEGIKARMKERGLTDEQIEERLERMRSGEGPPRRRGERGGSGSR